MKEQKEQYEPSQEEIKKAEEIMTPEQKQESEFREKVMSRGEYCGQREEGALKALELAIEGKGTPACINNKDWVILSEDDFKGLKEIVPHEFNKGRLKHGHYTWDFTEPIYELYFGSYMRYMKPRERIKKYRRHLRELKKDIAEINDMYNFAKTNGEVIKSGSGMSMIEIGKTYIVNKEGATFVVSEDGYERIYETIDELVEAVGAKDASEPKEDGQPGTVYWEGGWQGGVGGGVTLVKINGEEYYRQI